MSLYIHRDIGTNFSGDLQLDQKGDIYLSDALETHKAVANFILRTDHGEYAPDQSVGANLGAYIGATNTRSIHEQMEYRITRALTEQTFGSTDIIADVVPIDIEEAGCFVSIVGTYLISGELVSVDQERIVYTFPFIDGEPTPLTI